MFAASLLLIGLAKLVIKFEFIFNTPLIELVALEVNPFTKVFTPAKFCAPVVTRPRVELFASGTVIVTPAPKTEFEPPEIVISGFEGLVIFPVPIVKFRFPPNT